MKIIKVCLKCVEFVEMYQKSTLLHHNESSPKSVLKNPMLNIDEGHVKYYFFLDVLCNALNITKPANTHTD